MRKSILSHIRILEALEKIGLSRPFRECYRHSFQEEIRYRITRLLSNKTDIVKDIEGSRMIIDFSRNGLEKDLFIHGIRERESTELIKKELEKDMNVLDIGSNIGYYALIEAEEVGENGLIKAIEPTKENFERLLKNIELNDQKNIECVNKAAGSCKKEVGIKRNSAPNRNRIVKKNGKKSNTKVETVDNLAAEIEPDLIRMDVEGYELEIIKGMENVLQKDSLKLFLELHPSKIENFYDGGIEEIWEKLSENNFKIKYLIRHPNQAKLSYFFRKQHAPRQVLKPNIGVEKTLDNFSYFFNKDRTFRVFLEKN